MSMVTSSKETTLDSWRMLIYGPPKHGKTFTALTASEKFPDDPILTPQEETLVLDDLLFIEADEGGLDGLVEHNVEVPMIDVSKIGGGKLINSRWEKIVKEIEGRVKSGETKTVVLDTLSSIDRDITYYQRQQFPDPKHNAQMYGAVLGSHMRIFGELRRLPCNILILAHVNYRVDMGDSTQKAKQKATTLPGSSDAVPDITGKAGRFYAGAMSVQMPLIAQPTPTGMERYLYPKGFGRFEAGSRFTRFLNDKEEPHVRKMVAKIKNGLSNQNSS